MDGISALSTVAKGTRIRIYVPSWRQPPYFFPFPFPLPLPERAGAIIRPTKFANGSSTKMCKHELLKVEVIMGAQVQEGGEIELVVVVVVVVVVMVVVVMVVRMGLDVLRMQCMQCRWRALVLLMQSTMMLAARVRPVCVVRGSVCVRVRGSVCMCAFVRVRAPACT